MIQNKNSYIFLILILFTAQLTHASEICKQLDGVRDSAALKNVIAKIINNQSKFIKSGHTRHNIGNALNQCSPTKNSEGLVISFAGTGAFNPRSFHVMRELIQCNSHQNIPSNIRKLTYKYVLDGLKAKKSHYTNWSGVDKGILGSILKENDLLEIGKNLDYAVFPSEESELLANIKSLSFEKLKNILEEMKRSTSGYSVGITNALLCATQYLKEAKKLKIEPKLMIFTHSSGARSAVKFLEKLKLYSNKKFDLVYTMDPVIEAHEAILSILPALASKYAQKIIDYLTPVEISATAVKIWTSKKSKSLYKTNNSVRWVSTYQNKDTNGLGMTPEFGICGSPIENADKNLFLKTGLGASAHGEITYHKDSVELLRNELLKLF